jgi:uncharacterized membrane protein
MMVNEIVKAVAKQANLSEPVAQIAVDTVLGLLKTKLPPAVGSSLSSFLSSSGGSGSGHHDNPLGEITGALGGLLGKK